MTEDKHPDFFSSQVTRARRFYLDLKPVAGERGVVVSGGCEHCAPDYEIHRRSFRYLSIEYVSSGRGELTLDGNHHDLNPGTVFSYGPRIAQNIRTDPDDRLAKYFVDFVGDEPRELLDAARLSPGRLMQTSAPGEITALFENLLRNGERDTPYSARICAAILEQLLLKLAETVMPPGSTTSAAFLTYRRCRQYIEDHFMALVSLDQIAAECHVNAPYLCRLFRRFDHQRPYQLLVRLQMGHAAELLQQPGALVKEVAADMGCSDPYHFSRVFKRVHGIPPSEFIRLRGE